MNTTLVGRLLGLALIVSSAFGAAGCTTSSFCFANCDGQGAGGAGGGNNQGGQAGVVISVGTGGEVIKLTEGGTSTSCGTVEIPCNGIDDNCNGQVDEGTDYTDPSQCGTCANNCRALLSNVVQTSITCTPPPAAELGTVAGICNFTQCAQDFYNIDGNATNGCEYYCPYDPDGGVTIDINNHGHCGIDDNCNGKIDENLDTCTDPNNCGACGNSCVVPNGTAKCVSTAAPGAACTKDNTSCQVDKCDPGWWALPGGEGCWYQCTPTNNGVEICDGLDNDCDNKIDDADPDLQTGDPAIGQSCQGGADGICANPANAGVNKCILGAIACCDVDSNNTPAQDPNLPATGLLNGECHGTVGPFVIHPGSDQETCNGLDDDCDGTVDDNVVDVGQACGSSVGICNKGVNICVNGAPVCNGATMPSATDPCNGVDDNCDGVIDGIVPASGAVACTSNANCTGGTICMVRSSASDKVCATPDPEVGQACDPPPTAPCVNASGQQVDCGTAGATPVPQPCKAGTWTCAGELVCTGAVGKTSSTDACGVDSNCDGRLDAQPDLQNDVANCGACGHNCNVAGAHENFTCVKGVCTVGAQKCVAGYIDCDSNPNDCERACTPNGAELCNGVDDDCNCKIDDGIVPPAPSQVCGVSPSASDPNCGAGAVHVACTGGAWGCTFPSGYCNQGTPPSCSTTADVCDGKDNNCNGATDENQKLPVLTTGYLGEACASDDGKAAPGDGACRGTGVYVCNGTSATKCNAVRNTSAASQEVCDGVDNDCDGLVDETFNNPGTNAFFVKPAVVKVNSTTWMYQYEASRPNATGSAPGTGDGYWCTGSGCASGIPAAPSGVTLDKTPACSAASKIPWFNVTPAEVEETCNAMGGTACPTSVFTTACQSSTGSCSWGYSTACTTSPATLTAGDGTVYYDTSKTPFCNLGPYDFDGTPGAPNSDGLLPTGGGGILKGCYAPFGGGASTSLFDITGNLREITKTGSGGSATYPVMGGAFDTQVDTGAACTFTFYTVASTFSLYDTGFRCCFTSDPTQ